MHNWQNELNPRSWAVGRLESWRVEGISNFAKKSLTKEN
jgi:hypothetical protein